MEFRTRNRVQQFGFVGREKFGLVSHVLVPGIGFSSFVAKSIFSNAKAGYTPSETFHESNA